MSASLYITHEFCSEQNNVAVTLLYYIPESQRHVTRLAIVTASLRVSTRLARSYHQMLTIDPSEVRTNSTFMIMFPSPSTSYNL